MERSKNRDSPGVSDVPPDRARKQSRRAEDSMVPLIRRSEIGFAPVARSGALTLKDG